MTLAQALALGVMQGVTEFLPISSSGHLALAETWIPGLEQPSLFFDVIVHLGTLAAILWAFRARVAALGRGAWSLLPGDRGSASHETERRWLVLISVACVPTAIVGFALAPAVARFRTDPSAVGWALLATAGILIAAWRAGRRPAGDRELSLRDAFLVGAVQGLAVMPGISRSGATIATALWRGSGAGVAVEFSLLVSVPAILGANLFVFWTGAAEGAGIGLAPLAVGFVSAFVAGLLSLHALRRVVEGGRFVPFSVYCTVLGLGAIFLG